MNTLRKFIISILTSFILITATGYIEPQKIDADDMELDAGFPKEAFDFLLQLDPSSDCGLVQTFSTIGKLASGLGAVYSVYNLVNTILTAIGVFPDPEAAFRQQVKEKLDRITLQVDTINSRLTSVESTLIDQFAEAGLQNKALHAKELANQNTSFVNNIINVMNGYMRPLQDSISTSMEAYIDAVYSGDESVIQDVNIILNSKIQQPGTNYVKNVGETMTIPVYKLKKVIGSTSKLGTSEETIRGIFREFYHQEFNQTSYCYYYFCPLYDWLARKYKEGDKYPLLEDEIFSSKPKIQKFFKDAYVSGNLTGNMQELEDEFVDICYEGMCNFFSNEYFSEGEGTRKSLLGKIDTVFNNYYKALTTLSDSPIEREYSIIKDTYAFQGDLIYQYDQYVKKNSDNTYTILSSQDYNNLPNSEKAGYQVETINVNQIKDIHDYYYTLTAAYATFTISAYKACEQLDNDTLKSLINKWKEINNVIDNSFNSMAKRNSKGEYAKNYCYLSDSLVDFRTISSHASLQINYHEGGFFNNLDAYDSTTKSDWSKEYSNNDIVTTTSLKQLYAMFNANYHGGNFKEYLALRNINFTTNTNLLIGSEIQSQGLSDGNLNQHVYSWCVSASDWFDDFSYTTLSGNGHGTDGLDSSYRMGAFAQAMNIQTGAVDTNKLLASAAAFHQSRTSANDAMCIFYPGELEGRQVSRDVCGSVSSKSNTYIAVSMNLGNQYGALFKVKETNNLLRNTNPFTLSQYEKEDLFHISLINEINKTRNDSNYVSYYYDEIIGSIPYWVNVDKKYLDNTSKINEQLLNQITDYLLDNVDTIASEYNDLENKYKTNETFKEELLKVDLSDNEIERIANAVIYDYVDEVVDEYSNLPTVGDINKFYYCTSDKTVYGYDGSKYVIIAELGKDKLMCYYNANSTLDVLDDEIVFVKECASKKDIGTDKNIAYYCLQDHRIYSSDGIDITSKVNNIDDSKTNKNQLDCPDITKTYYVSDKFYNINLTTKQESVFKDISSIVNVQKSTTLPTLTSDKYYYVLENSRLYHKSNDGLSYESVDYDEVKQEFAQVKVEDFYKFNGTIYSILENGSFVQITPCTKLPELDTSSVIKVYGNYYEYNGSIWKMRSLDVLDSEPIDAPSESLDGYIYDNKAYLWDETEYLIKDYKELDASYLYYVNDKYYILDYSGLKEVDVEEYKNNYTDYIIKLNGSYYRYSDLNTRTSITSLLPTSTSEGNIIRDHNIIDDTHDFYIYSDGSYSKLDYETIFSINALPKPDNADTTYLVDNEFKIWGITEYNNDTRYIVADSLPEDFDPTKTYIISNTLYAYDYESGYVQSTVADLTYADSSFDYFENHARKVEGIIYKVNGAYYSYYKNLDEFVPYGMYNSGTIEELPIAKDNLSLMYKLDFHLMIDIKIDEDGNISHVSEPVFNIYPLLTWTDEDSQRHEFEVLDSELQKANVTCNVKVPIVKDDNTSNTATTNHYVSIFADEKDILLERLVAPIKGSKTNRYTEVKVKSFSPFMVIELSKLSPYIVPKTGIK